ncbi:hypothetical protein GW17_00009721 [Ensete ventricosum]|nr:hypothetical protein GW17_00009721 [Ensete ventricosum]
MSFGVFIVPLSLTTLRVHCLVLLVALRDYLQRRLWTSQMIFSQHIKTKQVAMTCLAAQKIK